MKGIIVTETKYVRFLTERQAADYAGMSLVEFRRDCPVTPQQRAQGRKVWDVYALDKWLDGGHDKPRFDPNLQSAIAQL